MLTSYKIIRSLGKGGMGEVFLAYDPRCDRDVALKRIREDLSHYEGMQKRFLREAKIASGLTHPSIIPIYTISEGEEGIYYTMPYVEGETLKEILKRTRSQEKKGMTLHPIGGSIPALIRIFLSVCQAVAYAHSKGVLHRDLKPENIIVGRYGEVMILDWGLAIKINEKEEILAKIPEMNVRTTRPGKVVGTLAYMSPERALGEKATISSDIYALGVILFQILTLKLPFKRPNLKQFRKQIEKETIPNATEIAPYRDIPPSLVQIVKKALKVLPLERYETVEEIIFELQNYIEGRPDWVLASSLDIKEKNDWEFQANILLAKHIAITGITDVMEWVSLMVSKSSFSGNTKIEAKVRLSSQGSGIGFLLSIPEPDQRKNLEEGYCLWIGASFCKLFRDNVEVMDARISFNIMQWHEIIIEKVGNDLRFYLDGRLSLNYLTHTPLAGTHIGVLYRDADFEVERLEVFVSSQSAMIGCLAIPDAFLAIKDYSRALLEYRRIGISFKGRPEGREAMFRAGVVLLEQAKAEKDRALSEKLFHLSLDEFEKLRQTPGAPLEYLGKSLVYAAMGEKEEELKCLELSLRKFPHHPLKRILEEHIAFRLHECSSSDRWGAYYFLLIALNHLPNLFSNPDHLQLLESLKKHLEPLYFLDSPSLALQLAFWLAKPLTLLEMLESSTSLKEKANILFCLMELHLETKVSEEKVRINDDPLLKEWLDLSFTSFDQALLHSPKKLQKTELRTFIFLIEKELLEGKIPPVEKLLDREIDSPDLLSIEALYLWTLLFKKEWEKASKYVEKYSLDLLNDDHSPLHLPYGALLWIREGKEIALIHFSGISDALFPPLYSLASHYLVRKNHKWLERAFLWEKAELYKQLFLFYTSIGEIEKGVHFKHLLNKILSEVQLPLYY